MRGVKNDCFFQINLKIRIISKSPLRDIFPSSFDVLLMEELVAQQRKSSGDNVMELSL